MPYSNEQIKLWSIELRNVPHMSMGLRCKFAAFEFSEPKAKEYALQGFCRRISTLERCINNVFHILPLKNTVNPPDHDRIDAAINVQAFIFNVFGCLDNLAHVLWYQNQIVPISPRGNNREFERTQIGLVPNCTQFRKLLSQSFQEYLTAQDEWFKYLKDFRDALAHRIPIYIPRIENAENPDAAESFEPYMVHSWIESGNPLLVHPRLLTDFKIVSEVAEKVLEELARK